MKTKSTDFTFNDKVNTFFVTVTTSVVDVDLIFRTVLDLRMSPIESMLYLMIIVIP